jgi:hypothetical protein
MCWTLSSFFKPRELGDFTVSLHTTLIVPIFVTFFFEVPLYPGGTYAVRLSKMKKDIALR